MHDIIIIGAGLAGSSLAHVLARNGWGVLLLERDTFPRHKVCGEFLSPESQGSLAALGLHDTVAALGPTCMADAELTARSGRSVRVALPGVAWGVSRYALDAALAQAAAQAGAELHCGVTASAVEREADGCYTATARSGGELIRLRARTVVMACGRHPPRALRAVPLRAPELTAVGVKCHFTGIALRPEVELYLFDGGYVGLAPVENGRLNLCMLASRTAIRRAGGEPRGLMEAAATWNPALGRRLADGTLLEDSLVSVAPVDTGDRPTPWHGAPRLGDAAVMIPPLCGDGQAMALRSAELCAPLADALLRGELGFDEWEAAYRAAWRREFLPRVRAARILQSALVVPGLAEAALAAGSLFPPLARAMVHATRGRASVAVANTH
jgi:menaquinone-9 beta-reductase